jgi:hypothetical protein
MAEVENEDFVGCPMILQARGMGAEAAPRANQQSDDLDLPVAVNHW